MGIYEREQEAISSLHRMRAKKYNLTEHPVEIEGRTYEAIYPLIHTAIDGLVVDVSYPSGNFYGEKTRVFILSKGETEWEKIYDDKSYEGTHRKIISGLVPLLLALETDKEKARIEKITEESKYLGKDHFFDNTKS